MFLILVKNVCNYLHATMKLGFLSRLNTGPRRICRINNNNKLKRKEISHGKIKMHSHDDTAVCVSNFYGV